ncbi:MAG: hypothetical protein K2M17_02260 [Bacilli bacterium]|nr:hypothetical protein [Bacilli bacterium]
MKKNVNLWNIFMIFSLCIALIGVTFSYIIYRVDKSQMVVSIQNTQSIAFVIDTPIYITKDGYTTEEIYAFAATNTPSKAISYDIAINLWPQRATNTYLKVVGPDKEEVKEIEGLKYTEQGFDITDIRGKVWIKKEYSKVGSWHFYLMYSGIDTSVFSKIDGYHTTIEMVNNN